MIREPRDAARSNRSSAAAVACALAATATLLLLGACASTSGGGTPEQEEPYPADVRVERVGGDTAEAVARDDAPDPLPPLPVDEVAGTDGTERRLSLLEASNETLRRVLRGLAESYGIDYRISPEVTGRVTTRLRDVTLRDALDAIVLPHGYSYSLEGGVLDVGPTALGNEIYSLDYIAVSRVGTATTIVQRRLGTSDGRFGAGSSGAGGVGNAGGVQAGVGGPFGSADMISTVEVSNVWANIRLALEALLFDAVEGGESAEGDGGAATVDPGASANRAPSAYTRVGSDGRRLILNPQAGTILVTATPEKRAEIEAYLDAFESSIQRQVSIEARIVEVVLDRESQFGIDWTALRRIGDVAVNLRTNPSPTPDGEGVELTVRDEGVDAVLHALETQGEVRVLSSPRVATLSNERAVMNVTTDEVFFSVTRQPIIGPDGTTIGFDTEVEPQQISVGIVLDVFPQISPDDRITMNIRPVVTDIARVERIELPDGTEASAPAVNRRETDTVVRVQDGETVVIGGLMQTRTTTEESGIPLLKDLPLLGALFRRTLEREEKRELVIFITPTIVSGQVRTGG